MLKIDNEFVEVNKNFVYSIVNKYATTETRDDLFQVGIIAMMKASEMYDENKGVKFSTFSYKYILGEILKYLRENKNIKQSKDVIKLYKKILELKEHYYILNGKNISYEELSIKIGIPEVKIKEIEDICKKEESIDKELNDEKYTLKDIIFEKEIIDKNDLIELKDALTILSSEEKEYIYQRYYENRTQTEIAKEKNINQVKVYRYERNLLDKLKDKMVS